MIVKLPSATGTEVILYRASGSEGGPTVARRRLRDGLERRGLLDLATRERLARDPDFTVFQAAELVLDELVANAVLHGGPVHEVRVELRAGAKGVAGGADHLWLGVWDANPAAPRPRPSQFSTLEELDGLTVELSTDPAVADPFGGWGLILIMTLVAEADRGVTTTGAPHPGKWVWARLPLLTICPKRATLNG